MTKEALTQLREVHAIQGRDGCWDIDDYMLGLYNGLELALSIVENRAFKYKQRPKSQPEQEPVAWEQFYPDIGKPQIAFNAEVIGYVAPQQGPVAWGVFEGNLHDMFFSPSEAQEMADLKGTHAEVRPLYTTPPQREFVGLTYEEKREIRYSHMTSAEFIEVIEAKLKDKNT